jgi:hypothetical protein
MHGPYGCCLLWTRPGPTRALISRSPVILCVSFTAPCRAYLARWSSSSPFTHQHAAWPGRAGCWLLWTRAGLSRALFYFSPVPVGVSCTAPCRAASLAGPARARSGISTLHALPGRAGCWLLWTRPGLTRALFYCSPVPVGVSFTAPCRAASLAGPARARSGISTLHAWPVRAGCWLLWTRAGLSRALFYCSPVLVGVSFTAPCRAASLAGPARARSGISTLHAWPGRAGCWLLWTRPGLTRTLFYCSPVLVGVSFTAPCRATSLAAPARARSPISTRHACMARTGAARLDAARALPGDAFPLACDPVRVAPSLPTPSRANLARRISSGPTTRLEAVRAARRGAGLRWAPRAPPRPLTVLARYDGRVTELYVSRQPSLEVQLGLDNITNFLRGRRRERRRGRRRGCADAEPSDSAGAGTGAVLM